MELGREPGLKVRPGHLVQSHSFCDLGFRAAALRGPWLPLVPHRAPFAAAWDLASSKPSAVCSCEDWRLSRELSASIDPQTPDYPRPKCAKGDTKTAWMRSSLPLCAASEPPPRERALASPEKATRRPNNSQGTPMTSCINWQEASGGHHHRSLLFLTPLCRQDQQQKHALWP